MEEAERSLACMPPCGSSRADGEPLWAGWQPAIRGDDGQTVAQLPPLALHAMLVADYDA